MLRQDEIIAILVKLAHEYMHNLTQDCKISQELIVLRECVEDNSVTAHHTEFILRFVKWAARDIWLTDRHSGLH